MGAAWRAGGISLNHDPCSATPWPGTPASYGAHGALLNTEMIAEDGPIPSSAGLFEARETPSDRHKKRGLEHVSIPWCWAFFDLLLTAPIITS